MERYLNNMKETLIYLIPIYSFEQIKALRLICGDIFPASIMIYMEHGNKKFIIF